MLRKSLYGGLGGILPLLATLAVVDTTVITQWVQELSTQTTESPYLKISGYIFRAVALFTLGAVWASLHKEVEPWRLVQLGAVAPAMVTALIQAGNVDWKKGANASAMLPSLSLIAPAYAQTAPPSPPPSPVDSFIKGILGKP